MKKTYVLDTNVLLSDPDALHAFDDNDVIIPFAVLEELDKHKDRLDEVGRCARQISRTLDGFRATSNLSDGVPTRGGGMLKISLPFAASESNYSKFGLDTTKIDNQIIAFTASLACEIKNVILVSKDINVRLKCDALKIPAQDYLKIRVNTSESGIYTGVHVATCHDSYIDELYAHKKTGIGQFENLFPNHVVVLKSNSGSGKSVLAKRRDDHLELIEEIDDVFGLKPRNKEQTFALNLLLDDRIKMMTLIGAAGTGKTCLAIAAALDQLNDIGSRGKYQKVIVTRPVQPMGRDIGFLPGTMEEKMEPWIAPIKDNISFLMGSGKKNNTRKKLISEGQKPSNDDAYLGLLQARGLIEIEAITFIRGRSIPNALIIIDECQNLTMHELKTIITRVGDGTKIILTGDIEQIDNASVDVYTNGLTYAVEKFKEYAISAHVTLIKGERSELATLASKIL